MDGEIQLHLAQRGVIVLPKRLREAYKLKPGDRLTLLDLEGVFVISRRPSEVDRLAGRISEALTKRGETLESMLHLLREERDRYGTPASGVS